MRSLRDPPGGAIPLIITQLKDDIGTITLNNPERHNALSKALVEEVIQAMERVQGLRRLVYDSDDYAERIKAFLEKRTPAFRGE